jgi:DNA polymerase III delta subunit
LHRSLRTVRAVRRQGQAPPEQIAGRLGLHPVKAKILVEAGRRWSETELQRALQALSKADRDMKTSADPRVALSVAVAQACGGARREASGGPPRGR